MIPDGWVGYSGSGTGDNTGPDPDDPDEITDEAWEKMGDGEQNDHFLDSIPPAMIEEWDTKEGYNKWIAAGKPKNWKEWQDKNPVEDITGDILGEGGVPKMKTEDIQRIVDGIKQGDKKLTENYSVPEDSEISNYLNNPVDGIISEQNFRDGRAHV